MSATEVQPQGGGRKKLTGWIVGIGVALVASLTALALGSSGVLPELGGIALVLFGWVPLATGLLGWCPIYSLLRFRTWRR